ncbi:MAG: DUF4401 domain-containing protein [Bacteroidota bacterium]
MVINKTYDKIIIDTLSVSAYITGFILIGFGCAELSMDENVITISFIILALASLSIVKRYVLSFVSIIIVNASILTLILSNKGYDLIHLYVSLLALALTLFLLQEAKIITGIRALAFRYKPIRIGLVVSLLSGLIFLGKKGISPITPEYIWLSSVVIIALIIYLVSKILPVFNIKETWHKVSIFGITVLLLLPTVLSPAISGAMLLILLSFLINYKTGIVLGVIAFIYFIIQYYYDLNFTLLTKSILLFFSGVLFLLLYFFTYKKLGANEKI